MSTDRHSRTATFDHRVSIWLELLGVVGVLLGLALALSWLYLITLCGSWYLRDRRRGDNGGGCSVLQGRTAGLWFYLAVFARTVVWAFGRSRGFRTSSGH